MTHILSSDFKCDPCQAVVSLNQLLFYYYYEWMLHFNVAEGLGEARMDEKILIIIIIRLQSNYSCWTT